MTILVFIIVLVVLILVHEFGHFVVAKLSGMRVDEFGIGFPPRLWGKQVGETLYSVNALPLGGFVRIYGEDETNPEVTGSKRAFSARPRVLQALTLVAGIAMNLLLAYVLITATLIMGTPRALSDTELSKASDVHMAISDVLPGSPAAAGGLQPGDMILSMSAPGQPAFAGSSEDAFLAYVAGDTPLTPLTFRVERNNAQQDIVVTPKTGVLPEAPSKPALGVAITPVGIIPETIGSAVIHGAIYTWEATKITAAGLSQFFLQAVTFHANLSEVSGPIGIAFALGNAYAHGFAALLSLAAAISISLAIINLLPIPALDGGRLLFVLIEAITRKPIKPSVAATINSIFFVLLIILLLVVSAHDIWVHFH